MYADDYNGDNFNIDGINWAACLPRGLQKFTSDVHLHHGLLQQLVQMPSLTEVAVRTLGTEATEVQSESCAWRILRLPDFRTWRSFGRFTAAMPLLHLYLDDATGWRLDHTAGPAQAPAVAKAAAWLSQISNSPKELSVSPWSIQDAASTVGVISALAPLSGLVSLELVLWPITERTLDELVLALPDVCKLTFVSCSISSGAWLRMLSLTSVTDLTISDHPWTSMDGTAMGNTVPLAQIIAFTSDVSHAVTLNFTRDSVSDADRAGWGAFKETLEEQRRIRGLPKITVSIISD